MTHSGLSLPRCGAYTKCILCVSSLRTHRNLIVIGRRLRRKGWHCETLADRIAASLVGDRQDSTRKSQRHVHPVLTWTNLSSVGYKLWGDMRQWVG